MGLGTALKIFWIALTQKDVATRFVDVLNRSNALKNESSAKESDKSQESRPVEETPRSGRSDAVELLAALQREARFVDFVKESLDDAEDAEIGAVARDVHNRCAATLERFFAIRPLADVGEGETIRLSANEASNASRVRIFGSSNALPKEGELTLDVNHAGWKIEKLALPRWQGRDADASVLAPIEASFDL